MGKAAELKLRFGAGFTFTVSIDATGDDVETLRTRQNQLHQFVMGMFPSAALLAEPIAGTAQYEVGRNDVVLSDVFERMEDDETRCVLFLFFVFERRTSHLSCWFSHQNFSFNFLFNFILNFFWLLRRIHRLTDWAITETTLDECFLKVTRRVHAEEDGLVRRVGRTLSTACREEIN